MTCRDRPGCRRQSPWAARGGKNSIPALPRLPQPAAHRLLTIICAGLVTGPSDIWPVQGSKTRHRRCLSRREPTREGSIRKRGRFSFIHRYRNGTTFACYTLWTRNSNRTCFPSKLEPDSRFVESNDKVSFSELPVQCHQFLVGCLVPVLGFTPRLPERLPNALGLIEGKVLINGTPRAIKSTGNPTIGKD